MYRRLFIESTLNYPWSDYLYQRRRNKWAPAGLISLHAAQCKCSYTSRAGVGLEIMQQLLSSIRPKSFLIYTEALWLSPYDISKDKNTGEKGPESSWRHCLAALAPCPRSRAVLTQAPRQGRAGCVHSCPAASGLSSAWTPGSSLPTRAGYLWQRSSQHQPEWQMLIKTQIQLGWPPCWGAELQDHLRLWFTARSLKPDT